MSFLRKRIRSAVGLLLAGLFFSFPPNLHAGNGDDEALIHDIHDKLIQAEAATTPADQQALLEAAYKALKALPPDGKKDNRRYKKAEGTIKSAIDQIKLGDPEHTVSHMIEDADSIVRNAE